MHNKVVLKVDTTWGPNYKKGKNKYKNNQRETSGRWGTMHYGWGQGSVNKVEGGIQGNGVIQGRRQWQQARCTQVR